MTSGQRYVYARHNSDPRRFFEQLDYFYYERIKNYPELEGREFKIYLNVDGGFEEAWKQLPYSLVAPLKKDIRFFRISIPFGDVAVEFGPITQFTSELANTHKRKLPQALESPLLGCDLTKSTLLGSLMARLHWASELISTSILEQAIAELISEGIPA